MQTERLTGNAFETVTVDGVFEVFLGSDKPNAGRRLGGAPGQNQEAGMADFGLGVVEDLGVIACVKQTLLAPERERFHAAALITIRSDACGLWRDDEPTPGDRSW